MEVKNKYITLKHLMIDQKEYLKKLELKKYTLNTCKTYVFMFEKFINYYQNLSAFIVMRN